MLLNLNAIMSIIANVPAATAATVRCSLKYVHSQFHDLGCRS